MFSIKPDGLCILINIRNYLKYHGIERSDNWYLGALGSFGFYFTENARSDQNALDGIGISFNEIFTNLQGILLHPFTKYSDITEPLTNKRICLAWIDEYFMEWSLYYGKVHLFSLIIILKTLGEQYLCFNNGYHNIDRDQLDESIYYAGNEIFFWDGNQIEYKMTDDELVKNGFANIIKNMRDQSHSEKGFEGLQYFINKVEVCDTSEEMDNYYFQINRPSGPKNTRKMLYELISEIDYASICPNREIYDRLSGEWKLVGNLLFRLSGNIYDDDLRTRIIKRLKNIQCMEKEGLDILEHMTHKILE